MIELKEWMEVVNYRITEGDSYGWNCYGDSTHQLSAWNGLNGEGGWSFNVVFDTNNQTVYEVCVSDYTNNRAYRLIHPDYKKAYEKEAESRGEYADMAWDDVDYVDLESDDDWIQKGLAIVAGEDYDTRVSIPLELPEEELMVLFKMAHEADMPFNAYIEKILTEALNNEEFVNRLKDKVK